MNAQRDAMAHRFVAHAMDETRTWSPELQVDFHELAFSVLPDILLELDAPSVCRFARDWKVRHERSLADPEAPSFTAEEHAWLAMLAAGHEGARVELDSSAAEISRLAALMRRFGPLALALPWRDKDVPQA